MTTALSIQGLGKTYASGLVALDAINLDIPQGEIFALLGPNGAGKTTLISIICGLVNPSAGRVTAFGHDIIRNYKSARQRIGLVPQELSSEAFETVWKAVSFSRGLYGCPPDASVIERVLRDLSLWDKRGDQLRTLSGGMKRRVMIAKALAHEPDLLFLDEPTAGVDVELRRDMWQMVRRLRESGVTIILTTHYIEEAEEMADRIGVINHGRLILVDDKRALMQKLGRKDLRIQLQAPIDAVPAELEPWRLSLADGGHELHYSYDVNADHSSISDLLRKLGDLGLAFKDLHTKESSLEEIFVNLVSGDREATSG